MLVSETCPGLRVSIQTLRSQEKAYLTSSYIHCRVVYRDLFILCFLQSSVRRSAVHCPYHQEFWSPPFCHGHDNPSVCFHLTVMCRIPPPPIPGAMVRPEPKKHSAALQSIPHEIAFYKWAGSWSKNAAAYDISPAQPLGPSSRTPLTDALQHFWLTIADELQLGSNQCPKSV